jgi:TonB family protein
MLNFLIQSSICLILFYGIYHFFLRNESFFKYNRTYLLSSLVLSILIPLLAPLVVISVQEVPVVHWQYVSEEFNIVSTGFEEQESVQRNIPYWTILYMFGMLVFLSRLGLGLYKIYRIRKSSIIEDQGDYQIAHTQDVHLPFSFWDTIYLSAKVPLKKNIAQVLDHERIHISQWHTVDVLFAELCHVLFWFNPILIWYKKSIKDAHEYLADAYVCQKHSTESYQNLLTSEANTGLQLALTHQLFHSQLKNRMIMMTKNPNTRKNLWKLSLALPILVGLVFIFSSAVMKPASLADIYQEFYEKSDTVPKSGLMTLNGSVLDKNVSKIEVQDGKIKVIKNDGSVEYYNLNKADEFSLYESKYGKLPTPPPAPPVPPSLVPDDVFKIVEEMPRFPGCEDMVGSLRDKEACAKQKLLEFLYPKVKYPAEARTQNIQGTAVVQFIVDTDGSITNIEVARDPGAGTGQAAADAVAAMNSMSDRWIPGKQKGKAVKVQYTLPIRFKLDDDELSENVKTENPVPNMTIEAVGNKEQVFTIVEEMPRFPGCEDLNGTLVEKEDCAKRKMLEFIYSKLKYPEEARKSGVEGTAVIQFIVDTDGTLKDVTIARDPGAGTGKASKDVVMAMNRMDEKWIPGRKNGIAVKVKYTMPIRFKIQDDEEETEKRTHSTDVSISNVKIYPNPNQGQLNVSFSGAEKDVQLRISDINGKVLMDRNYSNKDKHFNQSLDISNLPPQVLTVSIIQDGKIHTEKIVLSK